MATMALIEELPRETRLWREELDRIRERAETLHPAARAAVCRVLSDVGDDDDGVGDLLDALRPPARRYPSRRVRSSTTTSAPRRRRTFVRPSRSTATT